MDTQHNLHLGHENSKSSSIWYNTDDCLVIDFNIFMCKVLNYEIYKGKHVLHTKR